MSRFGLIILWLIMYGTATAQSQKIDTAKRAVIDTTIVFPDINYCTFKNPADQQEFWLDLMRIRRVLPYVKMAKHLYAEVQTNKEADTKKEYHHYRKDLEKEMRDKFEKEVKDLYISEGKVLVKLLNRETGNNCYKIIKEVKNGFSAWGYQIVARHYGYDLKETYNPKKEWILEMAIRYMGPEYNPN